METGGTGGTGHHPTARPIGVGVVEGRVRNRTQVGILACLGRSGTRSDQRRLEVQRKGARELHHLTGPGMRNPQGIRVQKLATEPVVVPLSPVHRIPEDGVPRGLEVHADLMGTPGLKPRLHEGEGPDFLETPEVRDGGAPTHGEYSLTGASPWIAADGTVYGQGDRKRSMDQSEVAPIDLPVAHHPPKPPMRPIVPRDDQQPRRIPVEPMHDARAFRIVPARNATPEKRMDDGPLRVAT